MKRLLSLAAVLLALCGCSHRDADNQPDGDAAQCALPDTLRVGTLYSPTSFFIYRGDSLGIDYEMVRALADSLHRPLKLTVGRSMPALLAMLDSGKIDLVAAPVPITSETAELTRPVGSEGTTRQVLVQRVEPGDSAAVRDVTDLPGRDVYVMAGTKYEQRLRNLDSELGGGINIHTLDADTVAPEDLIDMVADGKIPYAILDSDQARLHGSYHANINTDVAVSLDQRVAWAVAPGALCLADSIDAWASADRPTTLRAELLKHYYQLDKMGSSTSYGKIDLTNGTMSDAYDHIFRRYAPTINWDWRMLAAQAYTESRFNPKARSFAGARGLMQIMPRTGRSYGLRNPLNPEQSVRAAVSYLDDLNRMFENKVTNPDERKKFILAAYNAGQGHIFDAMRLAEKMGLNPTVWDDNVAKTVLMLANPKHYNDSVVKYGYLRGRETFDYVNRIIHLYNLGKTAIPV